MTDSQAKWDLSGRLWVGEREVYRLNEKGYGGVKYSWILQRSISAAVKHIYEGVCFPSVCELGAWLQGSLRLSVFRPTVAKTRMSQCFVTVQTDLA